MCRTRIGPWLRVFLGASLVTLVLTACSASRAEDDLRSVLAKSGEIVTGVGRAVPGGDAVEASVQRLSQALDDAGAYSDIVVDDPLDGAIFPADFTPPTVLWHDPSGADAWLVRAEFDDESRLHIVVAGGEPPSRWIDQRAFGQTNEAYEPTPYQASAEAWVPLAETWSEILGRCTDSSATVTIAGFSLDAPTAILSRGRVTIHASSDPVDGTVFYRDVPLMPAVNDVDGKIKPLGDDAIPIIEWRLRDLSQPASKVILTGMPTCANCHSFSRDGSTLAMDVDGPTGDKGAYGVAALQPVVTMNDSDVLTWNSFDGKTGAGKTIGFLSRISPDGRVAVSTVNEALYVENFRTHEFVQVFFPTRGILAWARAADGVVRALPGADDTEFVHCDPAWTPDGASLVFARAKAFDPPPIDGDHARYPNDPLEPQIRYDLYRMPFNDGQGGVPVAIAGASANGMSNSFPKVTPDGRFVVWVRCKNGQLLRPDSELWIVPIEGGEPRRMRCNTSLMNSWHSFSPNGRWMVFSSKSRTPYTQMFLTHIDENGNDSPAVLVPNSTAANRAVNLPEFARVSIDAFEQIAVPAVGHDPTRAFVGQAEHLASLGQPEAAIPLLERALAMDPDSVTGRMTLAWMHRNAGHLDAAVREFEHVLRVDPGNVQALGGALSTSHATPEELRRRLDGRLADDETRRDLAVAWLLAGDAHQALPLLERASADAPDDAGLLMTLAWLRAASHDVSLRDGPAAVAAAERACGLTSNAPQALDVLAAALAEAGKVARAVEVATHAIDVAQRADPPLAAWIARRRTHYAQGRPLPW